MRSHQSYHPSKGKDTSPGEGSISGDDYDLEDPERSDHVETPYLPPIRIPPRVQAPPSPSLSLSTTTSELEVEQGEALLKVKKAPVKEEDLDPAPFSDAEVISSDESEKPVPKKRKPHSMEAKGQGGKVKKPGMKFYLHKPSIQ